MLADDDRIAHQVTGDINLGLEKVRTDNLKFRTHLRDQINGWLVSNTYLQRQIAQKNL